MIVHVSYYAKHIRVSARNEIPDLVNQAFSSYILPNAITIVKSFVPKIEYAIKVLHGSHVARQEQ